MSEGFAAVPNWMIRDESVSLYAIAVYTALASHSGPGGIHPSQPTLAKEARCSESSVRRALVELEELGVVRRVRRKNRTGRASNGYVLAPNGRLSPDEEEAVSQTGTSGVVPVTETGGSGQGVDIAPLTEEEPMKKNPSSAERISAGLELVWQSWPSARRGSRKKAETSWRTAVKTVTVVDLQRLVRAAIAFGEVYGSWAPAEQRYVPMLSTWLNQERWTTPLPDRDRGRATSTVDHGRSVDQILAAREVAERRELEGARS